MCKLSVNPYDENDKEIDTYVVIAYNWQSEKTENLGLNVLSTILFFDKEKAKEYAVTFEKQTNCYTIIAPYRP